MYKTSTLKTAKHCWRETEEDLSSKEIYWVYGSEDSAFVKDGNSPQGDL